jgi:hypothetical protein
MATKKSSERVLTGKIGAYVLHSRYDTLELTKAARAAFESRFEREVDPDGILPVEEHCAGPRWPARPATRGCPQECPGPPEAIRAKPGLGGRRGDATRKAAGSDEVPTVTPTGENRQPRRRRPVREPMETVAV